MKKISLDNIINMVDSRYSLVTIVSRRARQIIDGSEELVRTSTIKPVAVAIEEFYEGKYEAIYDYEQYQKNLQESEMIVEKNSEEAYVDIEEQNEEQQTNNL